MLGGLKRRNTASHKTYGALLPSQTNSSIDGSGRAVDMDAPILKSVKNSSLYTRISYGWCFGSLWLAWFSWRWIRYEYGAFDEFCVYCMCVGCIDLENPFWCYYGKRWWNFCGRIFKTLTFVSFLIFFFSSPPITMNTFFVVSHEYIKARSILPAILMTAN